MPTETNEVKPLKSFQRLNYDSIIRDRSLNKLRKDIKEVEDRKWLLKMEGNNTICEKQGLKVFQDKKGQGFVHVNDLNRRYHSNIDRF